MTGATIENLYWETWFDRVYCLHYLPQEYKIPYLREELARVNLWQKDILQMRYTHPTRYDRIVFDHANSARTQDVGCVSVGRETLHLLREAQAFGYQRILVLENDIAFLKDTSRIAETLNAMPANGDIIQFDKFITPNGTDDYRNRVAKDRVNDHFFVPHGRTFYSGACFALSSRGIAAMADELEEALQPADSLFAPLENKGLVRYVAITNMAVQMVYADSLSARLWGINSHHDGYRRGDVNYDLYQFPDGYGYGKAL